jgi:2-oxoglutarate dehydrogenase E1 component
MMNQLFGNSLLFGGNAPFVEELYENYLDNPGSVSEQWREYFDKLAQLPGHVARDVPHLPVINAFAEQARKGGYRAAAVAPADDKKQVGILQMITAYRFAGDRWANLDPLKRTPRPVLPQLDPAHYGFPTPTSTPCLPSVRSRECRNAPLSGRFSTP